MRGASSKNAYNKVKRRLKDALHRELDKSAPAGLSSGGIANTQDDINDAWRHFSAAALSSQILGPDLTFSIGHFGEMETGDPLRKQMDLNNNDAGIKAGRTTQDRFEIGIEFINQVAKGRVLVIDDKSGQRSIRKAVVSDLPNYWDGDRIEDRYIPNPKTHLPA